MNKQSATLTAGDVAPAIDAPSAVGEPFSLAEHIGEWVIVFFYPKANTPG